MITKPIRYAITLVTVLVVFMTNATVIQANPEQPLNLKKYHADENSFFVSSVLITGKTEAVLVNAQLTREDAHRVVADILNSRKKLTTIYISHGDPDYYFGLEVIKQAFPKAAVVATTSTVAHIKKTSQQKLTYWGPKLGNNAPNKIITPEELKGRFLKIDKERLEIIGLDSKSPDRTVLWIPSLKAVVGGVIVYGNLHVWTADTPTNQDRQSWLAMLDKIEALKPIIVIPGHFNYGSPLNVNSVRYTRNYLVNFELELSRAAKSADLIKAMKLRYPTEELDIALHIGAKVATGEMKW